MARIRRGLSELIPGLIILVIFIASTAYIVLRITEFIDITAGYGIVKKPLYTLKIDYVEYTEVYGGPSIDLRLANTGSEALPDLGRLEVIVSYKSSGVKVVEILKFKSGLSTWTPGYWSITNITIGTSAFSYEEHPYLRPGEYVNAMAYISSYPDAGTLISIAIISPEAVKAEFSLVRG